MGTYGVLGMDDGNVEEEFDVKNGWNEDQDGEEGEVINVWHE